MLNRNHHIYTYSITHLDTNVKRHSLFSTEIFSVEGTETLLTSMV